MGHFEVHFQEFHDLKMLITNDFKIIRYHQVSCDLKNQITLGFLNLEFHKQIQGIKMHQLNSTIAVLILNSKVDFTNVLT